MWGCTNFPSRYENIDKSKTRPLAIVCEPAEAAPGDTVLVKYYSFKKQTPSVAFWRLFLDIGYSNFGTRMAEKEERRLTDLWLAGSTADSFRFVMPESTILYSSALRIAFPDAVPGIDSLLNMLITLGVPVPPESLIAIDQFRTLTELKLHTEADITLDVTKNLTVRYSRRFNSPNVNVNPSVRWVGIYSVKKENMSAPDSINKYSGTTFQYLYNMDNPGLVSDTVVIDSGCSYFVAADSLDPGVDTGRQAYSYVSYIDSGIVRPDTEDVFFDWFYTNVDYQSGMAQDSLMLFVSDRSIDRVRFLPPVETTMHDFKLYLTVRDFRPNDGIMQSTGVCFRECSGTFSYTAAYKRWLESNRGTGLF